MIGRLLQLTADSSAYLPESEKAGRMLPVAVAMRVGESLLLALVYLSLYPVLVRLFDGTLDTPFIVMMTAFLLLCYGLRFVLFRLSARAIYDSLFSLAGALRLRIAEHLRHVPLGYFQRDRLAPVKSVLTEDMKIIGQSSGSLLGFFVSAISLPVFITLGLALVDWRLAAAMCASTVLCFPLYMLIQGFVRKYGRRHFDSISASSSRLLEYILGIKVLKSYGLTGARFRQLEDALTHTKKSVLVLELGAIALLVVATVMVELSFAVLLAYGTYALLGGSIGPAALMFSLILAVRFYAPVQEALSLSTEFQYLNSAMDRVADILSIRRQESGAQAAPARYDIAFEDVSFSYDEGKGQALDKVSLAVPQGTMTALVGPSGAGKSTVANLIARFWDVEAGRVTVGGRDVRDMALPELMKNISIVFQDVVLFQDTLRENIRMARPEATDDEVIAAARQANCHEFIRALPYGYDTMAGEGGCRLSGGEKQRISIARALLKNAPIVLLDEATASVDPSAERDIQKSFAALARNKTLIVIAHKLSTIVHADQILVLDGGRVVQRGRHEELVAQDGLYRTLWENQAAARDWQV